MTRIQVCSSRTVLLLFFWSASCFLTAHVVDTAVTNDIASSYDGKLRSNNNQKTSIASSSVPKRQSVIRRLYGPENGPVRKHVRLLEERSSRSQTGFLGDPNHRIPYDNHPYDPSSESFVGRRKRQLQEDDGTEYTTTTEGDTIKDLFKPLRIKFVTEALDSLRSEENAAKIDFIETQVLPITAEFWSQALSTVPVSGNLRISSAELENREFCGDSEFSRVPSNHISTGVADVDLILYVSGAPSSRFCQGTTLAVAVACNFDQYDRPTAGAINVCLNRIELNSDGTASPTVLGDNVDVMIHEVAHVLGHSSNSYRFFWDSETGTPRTPRPFESRTVTCVDDVQRSLILPDENTMKFFDAQNGQRYAAIVTPKVRSQARNQFNCQSLEGAKLENQPTGSESCTGDHWDEHDYYPEALSGVISPTTNILSHLTLALFEDSGWYRANYTQGHMNPWGLGAGCDFVNGPCLVTDSSGATVVPPYGEGYFCNNAATRGCSPELSHKLACSIIDYFYIQPQTLPEPRFQYFPDQPTMGGPRQADFCPLFGSTFGGMSVEQLACTDTSNADALNIFSEVYGADSQCIPTDSGSGRCYRTACIKEDMVLRINIRGEWLACEYDFQKLDVRVGAGAVPQTLVCPRLSAACPDLFCPFNCAGRGVCNYENVVNGTIQPKCECFDPSDTSPGCSDSLLPTGAFLDDATGLFNNAQQDFFDPLIAVFVDHPDKWTSSSWAWAAGLLTVFFVLFLCICSTFWPESKKQKKEVYRGSKSPTKTSPRSRSSSRKRSSSQVKSIPSPSVSPSKANKAAADATRRSSPRNETSSSRRQRSSSASRNRASSVNKGMEHEYSRDQISPRSYPATSNRHQSSLSSSYTPHMSSPSQKQRKYGNTTYRPSSPDAAEL
ncbi:leishmanolysin-like protease [Nitzschia inconspicua]|uniref:Leishmanolysin-like protease n=1 Tax=Nitzschia inconspicua TaxID=303405 RepID=A0A9K3Q580_9STRA|nr:leishmanolysin-like protease [Nitzschia inconspicua]